MSGSKKNILTFLGLILILSATAFGELKLPKLVSDGMVLQRDAEVRIWGWATPGEKVSVKFLGLEYSAMTGADGNWQIRLPKLPAGGPYEMQITAGTSITLHDILVGDVWVCSGQSNMELPISRVIWNYAEELNNYTNPNIRQFYVPQKYDFKTPHTDLEYGNWAVATPTNLPNFSAVAFFFAKELYDKYQVPVGLINASLGGSPAQSWMSEAALKDFPSIFRKP
jgi:sialate O-acetylesterase